MKSLPRFTFGMGDRFGAEGSSQLQAILLAKAENIDVCPVWNKSNREHTIVGTFPQSLRDEADAAVRKAAFTEPYFVDADHINLSTVETFLSCSDFFTIDVADFVGKPADPNDEEKFLAANESHIGTLKLGEGAPVLALEREELVRATSKFLRAIQEAGAIYRKIQDSKGAGNFVTEVSIDETDTAQSPGELFCILAMLAHENIPVQTVAPKFTGRFNKGVDYRGDLDAFAREFDENLFILRYAIEIFALPRDLKLSIHSGSDKFSLYPIINETVKKHGCGLHLKTAGTTWLEEVIGLAEAGGEGLSLVKEIYDESLAHMDELLAPYRTVVEIHPSRLPTAQEVDQWDSLQFVSALRHVPNHPEYNPDFRQLFHIGFKIAAKMGPRFLQALSEHRAIISANVTHNLLERHLRPVFGGLS